MGRAGRPRKSLPEHMVVHVPDSVLGLPEEQFVHMRCAGADGEACARCIKPVRRRTALRYIKLRQLPNCPAHGSQPHTGCAGLMQCFDHVFQYDFAAHEVPVFSQAQGDTKWGRASATGRFKRGRDSAVDAVALALAEDGTWQTQAVEVDRPEHELRAATKPDEKRVASAEQNSGLRVLQLKLSEMQNWAQMLAAAVAE